MPPVDSNEPTQAPAPEQPKKLGFWAKLFGKKETPAAQQPAPQPADTVSAEPEQSTEPAQQPTVGLDVTPPAQQPQSEQPVDLSRPVPTVPADQQPTPLDIPSNLQAQGIDVDGTNVSPSLPTQPPAAGGEQSTSAPSELPTADSQSSTDQSDSSQQ